MPDHSKRSSCYNIAYLVTERKVESLCHTDRPPEQNERQTIQKTSDPDTKLCELRHSYHIISREQDVTDHHQVITKSKPERCTGIYLEKKQTSPYQAGDDTDKQQGYYQHMYTGSPISALFLYNPSGGSTSHDNNNER